MGTAIGAEGGVQYTWCLLISQTFFCQMKNRKRGGYFFLIIFNHCKIHIPALLLLQKHYSCSHESMCKCKAMGACVPGWADEAWGANPETEVLPEQTQEHTVCVGQTMLPFPTLAGLYLALLWSGKCLPLLLSTQPIKNFGNSPGIFAIPQHPYTCDPPELSFPGTRF